VGINQGSGDDKGTRARGAVARLGQGGGIIREAHSIIALQVGERLKSLRGSQTQAEFALRLGLSQVQYNRYETGKRLAPDRVLEAVAQRCGLTPQEVIWGRRRPAPVAPVSPPSAVPDDPTGAAVARLVALLDEQSLEDLYFFLRQKTEALARSRRQEDSRAQEDLELLKRRAG
jgi:transcriptional regulator with XRE-family HTH domain